MGVPPDSALANPEQVIADLRRELSQRAAERDEAHRRLDEAQARETATAEVLQVINASPGDLAPVFALIVDKAIRLCEAACGHLLTYDGQHVTPAAVRGEREYTDYMRSVGLVSPGIDTPVGRALRGEPVVHIADAREEEIHRSNGGFREQADMGGFRSMLVVGLRREDTFLGTLTVFRQEVRPFSDKHIALLQNFAAQAVIAMENARLITETREALNQQTATAEVLGVINSSPGDLAPVFDAMLEKATRLCDASYGLLATYDAEGFRGVAAIGLPMESANALSRIGHPPSGTALGQLERTNQTAQIADILLEPAYSEVFPVNPWLRRVRTNVVVPMLKEGELIGAFILFRQEVRPFSDKQIALLQNFAAQAVIAIENARLITETREALEQQTATAEVLQVINSSPGDLAPVFDAILEKAHSLCQGAFGILLSYDGKRFRHAALHSIPAAYADFMHEHPPVYGAGTAPAQLAAGERFVHVLDITDTASYRSGDPNRRAIADLAGARTLVAVPLRKDGALLGAIVVFRQEVRPFTDKQIALLQNFAAQAVIAMENARLITETREALEQQTATAEVLGVINSSPGELQPVFDNILEHATRICAAQYAMLTLHDGEGFRGAAVKGFTPLMFEHLSQVRRPAPGTGLHAIEQTKRTHQILDATAEPVYDYVRAGVPEFAEIRSMLHVPLLREGTLIGGIVVYRKEVRVFSAKEVALLQNFAAQAVIAMENARLITETREALEQQTATAEVLGIINSTPGELAPVFDAMLEKAMRLCDAAFGLMMVSAGDEAPTVAARGVPAAFAEYRRKHPVSMAKGPVFSRLLAGEDFVHTIDLKDDDAYRRGDPLRQAMVDLGGGRTSLMVALRRDRDVLGAIHIYRQEVRPFTDKQIALLENFAAQAVVAM